ncbi:rhodanese-like domain-containing protein [Desulfobulbus alkaliphilus]|uniref:rhodanese-like domain-containing protein n=1 Tax=Desulfobulbus alkaliphilus TaxID=869814 RepID=UPI0019657741|nr:rhodanese-like domain-containing protein [Desulfobulbus alkaliphilus]MBM9537150.1 rhodanese [Desulfobulbus alkaliphilus]
MSPASAGLAKKLGYTDVRVYLEGEPVWLEAFLPTYSSEEFILHGNVVLVDMRPRNQVIEGRIQGAYSVPFATLENALGDLARNAPIVLYGEDEYQEEEAIFILRAEGFRNVSLVRGGYQGWLKNDGAIESGPIFATEITWVRQLGRGEVSVADFRRAASGEDTSAIIIDARTREEVAELGTFRHTINMPLDEIPSRMDELPRDKTLYVHCATGARADMAYSELVNNGFDVKFLLLDIQDAECDCEIIRPEEQVI